MQDEDWARFVLNHTRPLNVAAHLLSAALFVGSPVVAALTGSAWWLLGFFSSGLVAAGGHVVAGEGADGLTVRRVTSSGRVLADVARMTLIVLRGGWSAEVARARAAVG